MGYKTTTDTTDEGMTTARTTHDVREDIVYAEVRVRQPEHTFERNCTEVVLRGITLDAIPDQPLLGPDGLIDVIVMDADGRAVAAALTAHYAERDRREALGGIEDPLTRAKAEVEYLRAQHAQDALDNAAATARAEAYMLSMARVQEDREVAAGRDDEPEVVEVAEEPSGVYVAPDEPRTNEPEQVDPAAPSIDDMDEDDLDAVDQEVGDLATNFDADVKDERP